MCCESTITLKHLPADIRSYKRGGAIPFPKIQGKTPTGMEEVVLVIINFDNRQMLWISR
jgi:hypothetical protein